MKTNELVEVSQDREAWRELVVARVLIYNRPIREREREIRKGSFVPTQWRSQDHLTSGRAQQLDIPSRLSFSSRSFPWK